METINLSSARGVHERMDGHEELEGLDHAFMLDMQDGVSYILYTDNDTDKVCRSPSTSSRSSPITIMQETLASLIVQTAGI